LLEEIQQLIKEYDVDPNHSVLFGNKYGSHGKALAVTNVALMPMEKALHDNENEPLPQSQFEFNQIKNWREAEEKILKSIIHRGLIEDLLANASRGALAREVKRFSHWLTVSAHKSIEELKNARSYFQHSRNYILPNGKVRAWFIDIDGTCMVCQPLHDEGLDCFAHAMHKLLGVDVDKARQLADGIIKEETGVHGFERDIAGKGMVKAYVQLCQELARETNRHEITLMRCIGACAYFRKPVLFDNCLEVLQEARKSFYLVAVTIGNKEAQEHKIKASGLGDVFDTWLVLNKVSKDSAVLDVVRDLNIDPRFSGSMGNSYKSDGVMRNVVHYCHLLLESAFNDSDSKVPHSEFDFLKAANWSELRSVFLLPLLEKADAHFRGQTFSSCRAKSSLSRFVSAFLRGGSST
jgi:FMN phosphatase YigB (HAD superfamily)